ncbi:MAG: DNA translocase FtsK [Eubacteriales bacterium]
MASSKKKSGGTAPKPKSRAKTSSSARKTTSKSKTAKSSAKSSPAQNRSSHSETGILLGILLLSVCGIFLLACLLFPDITGTVGGFLHDFMLGLFGRAAYFIPAMMLIGAYFFRKDVEFHAVSLKVLFGFLLSALIGVLFHTAVRDDPMFDTASAWDFLCALYDGGTASVGGGVLGGLLCTLLGYLGLAGTWIVSVPAIFLLSLFFVGMTPKSLWITILYKIYRHREKHRTERDAALREMETRSALMDERQREITRMRAEHAERHRSEEEQISAQRKPYQTEQESRHRAKTIDDNIYADASSASAEASDTAAAPAAGENTAPKSTPDAPKPRRSGAPVPEAAYDRGPIPAAAVPENGITVDTQTGEVQKEDAAADIQTGQQPEAPDETAYTLAAQDEAEAIDNRQINGDTAGAHEILSAEATASPASYVPTGEIDLSAIFSNPKDELLLKKYGPGSVGDTVGHEPEQAEIELTVTKTVPDGCPGPDNHPSDSGYACDDTPPWEEQADTCSADPSIGQAKAQQAAAGEPDAAAILASLNTMYGTQTAAPAPVQPQAPQYVYPPVTLLKKDTSDKNEDVAGELETNARKLTDILRSFNVRTKIVNVSRGPTITRYELQPESGTRVRSVANLVDDIALGLAADGVRIEAPIPGKSAIGIEVPNQSVSTVYIRDLIDSDAFRSSKSKLTTALGMDVAGAPVFLDAAKMPHLLICGATGMGKSVCINALIISVLYKATPEEVKLILVDPKKVELNIYSGIPHLLVPVVSDPKKAAGALHWAVTEMERRFELIEDVGMRDIKGYNDITKNDPEREYLPQIVIIIDELADLMMTAPDEVEESICRLAQKARAAGMHLIIGTQRPSVDVITGLIKANIPSRIAFRVSSQMDSRVILDEIGAEKLIGRGDMLYKPVGATKPKRVQGSFVSEDEIEQIITFLKKTAGHAEYADDVMASIEKEAAMCGQKKSARVMDGDDFDGDGTPDDPMLKNALELAVESGKISTSLIQRRLSLGYGRAAKLIDRMEQLGYVSPPEGQKPRQVLITKEQYMELVLKEENIL